MGCIFWTGSDRTLHCNFIFNLDFLATIPIATLGKSLINVILMMMIIYCVTGRL
ncbi:hypothetical protein Hdeb2414_s0006g00215971 [Helianthus debilis subsp. tardiflorus]